VTDIVRVFDASRERLWRAWTDPDELVRWWGKRGWSAQRDSLVLDVREGAAFRIVSVSDAGEEMVNAGVWHEVVPFERLAFGPPGAVTSVVTFADLGDGRSELRFTTSREISGRAAAGFRSGLDRLAELLTTTSTRSAP
jgi:uncharacterized protein YndB with AHSA1/START domain